MRRAVFVDETAEIGGAEINLLMVTPRLNEYGWEPIVALPRRGRLAERLRERGVAVELVARPVLLSSSFYVAHRHKLPNPLALPLNALLGLIWMLQLARFFRRARPDVVQTVSMWAHAFAAPAARMAGCAVVWHFQGIVSPRAGFGLYRALVLAWARLVPDRIICISEVVADQFRDDPRVASKLCVLWNTVDIVENHPAGQASAAAAARPFTIGTAARLTPWKGQEIALRAARELKRRGVPFRWRFAGEEALGASGYRRHLLDLIRDWDLAPEVDLAGWVADMPAFYQSLDALAHVPTEPEPFGLVLAEALAAGLPVIATPGGADRVVEAGGGVLVPPGDAHALAAALAALHAQPAALAARRSQARRAAEQLFDTRRYAAQLAAIFEALARPEGRGQRAEGRRMNAER
ncbi:MAG: glycosyltransferase family 4 protein [Kouleothrix sp.]|nr:glycosyltransferase family 4 protein [Kouleothrix sp.]